MYFEIKETDIKISGVFNLSNLNQSISPLKERWHLCNYSFTVVQKNFTIFDIN